MRWQTAAAVVFMVASGPIAFLAVPENFRTPDTTGETDVYDKEIGASIVGEFRSSLAEYLFVKADEYMHRGVIKRKSTDAEANAGAWQVVGGEVELDKQDAGQVSMIPEPPRDPRGVWGYIERDTKPWEDVRHHGHEPLEALPLYRLMTWADPTFIDGYDAGALAIDASSVSNSSNRAYNFLAEGVRNNPKSYLLHKDLGEYLLRFHRSSDADRQFEEAIRCLPKGPAPDRTEQLWQELVQSCRTAGFKEKEIRFARQGLTLYPDDITFTKSLAKYGLKL